MTSRVSFRRPGVGLTSKRPWILAAGVTGMVIGETVTILQNLLHLPLALVATLQFGFLLPGIALLFAFRKMPRRATGELTVDDAALRLDGQMIMKRSALRQAVAFRHENAQLVRLKSRARAVDLRLATEDDAQELLAAIGQSTQQTTAKFPVVIGGMKKSWIRQFVAVGVSMLAMFGFMFLLLSRTNRHGDPLPLLPFIGMLGVMMVLQIVPALAQTRRLIVGADGFVLRTLWRTERFVSFRDLRSVRIDGTDVVLSVHEKAGVRDIRLGCGSGIRKLHGVDADAPILTISRRLEDARKIVGASQSVDARALLARGDRSRTEWRRAMDRLVDDAASFRSAAIPADELWKVLVDPTEPAQFRAGAALALRRNLDDQGRARVRVAANASAEAPLKRVLAAVNEEDDAALDEALDALDRDAARLG